jgi:hypothetical protein
MRGPERVDSSSESAPVLESESAIDAAARCNELIVVEASCPFQREKFFQHDLKTEKTRAEVGSMRFMFTDATQGRV